MTLKTWAVRNATSDCKSARSLLWILLACTLPFISHAGPYENAGQRASSWLNASMIAADETWGTEQDLKYLTAAEVALSLASWNRRGYEYYAAITWLSNRNVSMTLRHICSRV